MSFDLSSLPDFPSLQQLARALWRNGSLRGAAILVGAGFSKNAELTGSDTPAPPLWSDLLEGLKAQLYPPAGEGAPTNPLRLAEEYRTYLGQAALDDFIRMRFPDRAWQPGRLHEQLLNLPWSDVLTTNWDTLLERAAQQVSDYTYEFVRFETDLPHARSPRIVKLHGTLGDTAPLIFAEEDYRTYPAKHAAYVNLARQIFIENELCLIGFSGEDPNFLQWAGWVRDQLGGTARRIYLVGCLNLPKATRKFLEAHNIAPIDFAPAVAGLPKADQHAKASELFFETMLAAKPSPRHEWPLLSPHEFPLIKAGAESAVQQAAQKVRMKLAQLAGWNGADVTMRDGNIIHHTESLSIQEVLGKAGLPELASDGAFNLPGESMVDMGSPEYPARTFGAIFVEVGVDPELGLLRLRRATGIYSAGRIINPLTASSQMIGGIVWGWGMAAMEASHYEPTLGRWLAKDLAGVAIPVNADIPPAIDVGFVDEFDANASPIGAKGIGELGATGVAAAVANAVFDAIGIRIRDLPITPDKILNAQTG